MQAAQHPCGRHRAVGLPEIEVVPGELAELAVGEPFEEDAARVAAQRRRDLPRAGDRQFTRAHWPRSEYVASTASFNGFHHDSLLRYQSMVSCRPSSKFVCLGPQPNESLRSDGSIA